MSDIPEWLAPYLKEGAYSPTEEDVLALDPQSREEMLLKAVITSMPDMTQYYQKSETYSKLEINDLVSAIPKFSIKVVPALPTEDISPTTIYLVTGGPETDNFYSEYIYVDNKWELLGEVSRPKIYTATLLASGWSSQAPYTQTVNISGILSTDTPIIDVVLSSTVSTAILQTESWGYVSKIETRNGSIFAVCLEEKPTVNIPIQLKLIR